MNNIILIGMAGCGKSTVGVLLAKMAGLDFLDSDLVIQKKTGKKLFELIEELGPEEFLKIEDEVNRELCVDNCVIATGGSAVYCERAMEHLKSIGKVVYLRVSKEEIRARIGDFSKRGIVMKRNLSSIDEIYDEREPLYKKYADVTVDCNKSCLKCNAETILSTLNIKY